MDRIEEIVLSIEKKDPDNFRHYYGPDSSYVSYVAVVKYYYYERLGWCGCGRPGDALRTIAKFLKARQGEWEERNAKLKESFGVEHVWENELLYCLAYVIDAAGFTEHGSSIYSAWITPDGENFLYAIEEAEKREELDI